MSITISTELQGLGRCPHCSIANPYLARHWVDVIKIRDTNEARVYACFKCSSCDRMVMAEGWRSPLSGGDGFLNERHAFGAEFVYPRQQMVDDDLPDDARRYLKQAMDTLSSPDASVVMSASSVDAMLKTKGYVEGNLYSRIDKAVKDHILTDDMGKWAHKIRLEANSVRHADQTTPPPSLEDATQVLEFAKALGDLLFVFTARVAQGIKQAGE